MSWVALLDTHHLKPEPPFKHLHPQKNATALHYFIEVNVRVSEREVGLLTEIFTK